MHSPEWKTARCSCTVVTSSRGRRPGNFSSTRRAAPRRLLLHKREIFKLEQQVSQKGCSLVALKLYWKNGKVKLALGLGKGKTHRDQRYDLKARVEMREAQREVARINRR